MFDLKGVSLWVINKVSNTHKHLRITDEGININMRTAEEKASLALFIFYSNKKRIISAVFFQYKLNLEQNRGYWEQRRILIRLLKL